MRLVVSDIDTDDVSFDTIRMSITEFNDVRYHPFIVSHSFDEIVIDLSEKVKVGHVRPLLAISKVIPKVVGEITTHTVSILCELYPDRSAQLRYTFMRDKEELGRIVERMKTEYGWADFY